MMEHEDFYQNFRNKMQEWVKSKDGRLNKFADILLFGPDLISFAMQIIS